MTLVTHPFIGDSHKHIHKENNEKGEKDNFIIWAYTQNLRQEEGRDLKYVHFPKDYRINSS